MGVPAYCSVLFILTLQRMYLAKFEYSLHSFVHQVISLSALLLTSALAFK